MATNDPQKKPIPRRRKIPLDDEQAEREYKADMRRLALLQRRLRLYLSLLFVGGPFTYVMAATIAESFGATPADLNWVKIVPFTITGIVLIFGLDYRTAITLFGGFFANIGAALSKMGDVAQKVTKEGEEDEP